MILPEKKTFADGLAIENAQEVSWRETCYSYHFREQDSETMFFLAWVGEIVQEYLPVKIFELSFLDKQELHRIGVLPCNYTV